MNQASPDAANALEPTYPLRTAARLTGLSPSLLRAWERRHAVVEPLRTAGGTRRYRASDLERLRQLKAAVDAGHRISQVAKLATPDLERIGSAGDQARSAYNLNELLAPLEHLDAAEFQRLASIQFAVLGPSRFARSVAVPLVERIGERWENGEMGIAHEHLATGVLRSLLGSACQPSSSALLGPRIVFGTPYGERHELGLLMATLTAVGAGANPLYLGAELPVEDLLGAVEKTGATALALSIVALPKAPAMRSIHALRSGLPDAVQLWLGGSGVGELELPDSAERIESLEALEQRVMLLVAAGIGT